MKLKWIFVVVLVALFAGNALAWDDGGHLLIGEIAARRLRPEVVREMEALIPLLDRQFNGGKPYNLVTVGVWLDDQRGLGKANPWGCWHYVDFPVGAGANPPEPPPPHALWGLDQAAVVLVNRENPAAERAIALAQVIHIVGDIHQPMHAADRRDRGGNEVGIMPLTPGGNGPANLHAFWDAAYRFDGVNGVVSELGSRLPRSAWPKRVNEPGWVAREASAFLELKQALTPPGAPGTRPWVAWAHETYAIACQSAWPAGAVPKGPPMTLSPEFVHEAHGIAQAQIVKAGVRLGDLLSALLGAAPPAPVGQAVSPAVPAAAGR
jgi:hypothetical protein